MTKPPDKIAPKKKRRAELLGMDYYLALKSLPDKQALEMLNDIIAIAIDTYGVKEEWEE